MKRLDMADDEAICLLRHVRLAHDACKERTTQLDLKGPATNWADRQSRAVLEADCILLEQIKRKLWFVVSGGTT